MAAMMLASTAETTFHASEIVSENQSVVKSTNNNKGALKTAKDKIKSLGKWVENHPGDVVFFGLYTGIISYFLIEKYIQYSKTVEDFINCGEELLKEHQKVLEKLYRYPNSGNNITLIKTFIKTAKKFATYCGKAYRPKEISHTPENLDYLNSSIDSYFKNKQQYDRHTDETNFTKIGDIIKRVIEELKNDKFRAIQNNFKINCENFSSKGTKFQKYGKLIDLINSYISSLNQYKYKSDLKLNGNNYMYAIKALKEFSLLFKKPDLFESEKNLPVIKEFLENVSKWETRERDSEQFSEQFKNFLFNPGGLQDSLSQIKSLYEGLLRENS